MGVAKYKLKDGSTSDYYAWDGDLLNEPTLLTSGVGSILNTTTGPTLVNLGTGEVETLKNYCRANVVARAANFAEDAAANAGTTTAFQALLDELTVHTD